MFIDIFEKFCMSERFLKGFKIIIEKLVRDFDSFWYNWLRIIIIL